MNLREEKCGDLSTGLNCWALRHAWRLGLLGKFTLPESLAVLGPLIRNKTNNNQCND